MIVDVPLADSYRLLNHGPTTLLTTRHGGRTNVMAAAWVTPLDIDPPKLTAVIASDTFTRELVEASGEVVVNVPTAALADVTLSVGRTSGRELDKFAVFPIRTRPAKTVAAPLLEGCVAWLECRVIREQHVEQAYDLFILEVLAASADGRVFKEGVYDFEADPSLRTLHHLGRSEFLACGERIRATKMPGARRG